MIDKSFVCKKGILGVILVTLLVCQRNWVFATNSNFLTPIASQPDGVNLWYFKLKLFDLKELIVWNIKGLGEWVAKL